VPPDGWTWAGRTHGAPTGNVSDEREASFLYAPDLLYDAIGPVHGWEPVVEDEALLELLQPDCRLVRLAGGAAWAEGPVWWPQEQCLLWSDIPNDRVLKWHVETGVETYLSPAEFQNGHTLDLDGSILACSHGRRRIERMAAEGAAHVVVERYEGLRFNSPNDVVVKSDATVWFTDPPYGIESDREGHAAASEIGDNLVFRFDPTTGRVDAVTDEVEVPNGLAFSPDESILYVSDTASEAGAILAFDVLDGRFLGKPREFYVVEGGVPDGFRVDVAGNVWTSAHDGIHVVASDGRRLGSLPVPERTSNCAFGGADGKRLFITASTSLYAVDVAIGSPPTIPA
jgi:gluconolactonase